MIWKLPDASYGELSFFVKQYLFNILLAYEVNALSVNEVLTCCRHAEALDVSCASGCIV